MCALQGNGGGAVAGFELQTVVAFLRESCNLGWQMHGLNYGDRLMPKLKSALCLIPSVWVVIYRAAPALSTC